MFGNVFSLEEIEIVHGYVCIKIEGRDIFNYFKNESGGHRWQRVSPTERHGRRHTSTITVAVLSIPQERDIFIDPRKLKLFTCRGSGPGGQHRNKTESAVQIEYEDINIRIESERSQYKNKELALELLRSKIQEKETNRLNSSINKRRKDQVGSGMRGDKRRTIRVFEDQVKDHITNKSISFSKYEKGFIEDLWE